MTGGIGEHEPLVRTLVAEGLGYLGVVVNDALNAVTTADRDISRPGAEVRTAVVTASEATEIARETRRVLSQ